MNLILKVLDGPLKDRLIPVIEGLTLGREGATVNLNDPKVSTLHAEVRMDANGLVFLADNGSKNGIRVNGEKVDLLALKPGVTFVVGSHRFEVVAEEAAKPTKRQRYWHDVLARFAGDLGRKIKDNPHSLDPLDPALVLEFVKGPQVNSKWILGFGPRQIGATSVDLPIWEPGAPAVCFEIHPSAGGLVFQTEHPDKVLLNGESVDSRTLRMGDTIQIQETLIEVDFTE